jgi:ubiquinone/menaquinone biosynthesis C-methylase UbiE
MGQRTAAACAGFLLPFLSRGMSLLDCGCGPGSITVDFAQLLTPGHVVGLDREPSQAEAARNLAKRKGSGNARFMVADVYKLPFSPESFDAVFCHALLMHLRQPLQALKEMRRVLKPEGMIAIVDPDFGARIWSPTTPLFDEFQALFLRVLEYNGASLYYARHQRRILLEAGFARAEAHTFSVSFGNTEATKISATSWVQCALSPVFREVAVGQGWVDDTTLHAMCAEVMAWSDRPDAFNGLLCCGTLGWV